jgi:hypothetical protein
MESLGRDGGMLRLYPKSANTQVTETTREETKSEYGLTDETDRTDWDERQSAIYD